MNQKRWLTVLGLTMLILVALMAGCGQTADTPVAPDNGENQGNDDANAAASIMIGGSDSEVNVVTRLAEEYMNDNPHVSIAVTGGGSGVGISSLIDGDIDIANSSRWLRSPEPLDQKPGNRLLLKH